MAFHRLLLRLRLRLCAALSWRLCLCTALCWHLRLLLCPALCMRLAALCLHRQQPMNELVAELRRAFSGIVAGNVKDFGVLAVAEHGPFQLQGDADLIAGLGELLGDFVEQGRMKLDTQNYTPCFELASKGVT